MYVPPADQTTCQCKERLMNVGATIKADSEAAELLQPSQSAFDHPTCLPQPTAMLILVFADDWLYSAPPEFTPMPPRAVGSVSLHAVRPVACRSLLAFCLRYGVGQGQQLRDIVRVGGSDFARQGNALSLGDEVMLTA
jgi:hypothetical protein